MNVPSTQSRVGTTIAGRYSVIKLLGEGGMGAVYEAEHIVTRRRVAVKVMHAGMGWSEVAVARFVREARVSAAIGHPNVVEVLDAGSQEDDSPFIVLELLEGESYASRLAHDSAVPIRESIAVAIAVLDVLATAHAKGIVHRDIKPENVFLLSAARGGATKVLDFGISKVMGGSADALEHRTLTKTGSVLGTADYMSPEQVRGESDIDGRTDVWAVGVMLYRAIAGHTPFQGNNYNTVVLSVMTEEAPPLARVVDGVPVALSDIVARALVKDRKARWPDATSMREALRALLETPDADWERARVSVPGALTSMSTQEQREVASLPTLDSNPGPRPLAVAAAPSVPAATMAREDTLSARETPTRDRAAGDSARPFVRRAVIAVASVVVLGAMASAAFRSNSRATSGSATTQSAATTPNTVLIHPPEPLAPPASTVAPAPSPAAVDPATTTTTTTGDGPAHDSTVHSAAENAANPGNPTTPRGRRRATAPAPVTGSTQPAQATPAQPPAHTATRPVTDMNAF